MGRSCLAEQDAALKALIADMLETRVVRKYLTSTDLLPIIRADLQAALWRMVDLCLRLGRRNKSNDEARFALPPALANVGVPTDAALALDLANAIRNGLTARGIGRAK